MRSVARSRVLSRPATRASSSSATSKPPRPPVPHLPPLPVPSTWPTYFPRRILATSAIDPAWIFRGRVSLANKDHCDAFVRDLGIRPGEVIVEVYPGPGQLTRSLLEGGASVDDAEAWKSWEENRDDVGAAVESASGAKTTWPAWSDASTPTPRRRRSVKPSTSSPSSSESSSDSDNIVRPAAVVVAEPSAGMLSRAFNHTPAASVPFDARLPRQGNLHFSPPLSEDNDDVNSDPPSPSDPSDIEAAYVAFSAIDHPGQPQISMEKTPLHPNLILSESSVYRWPTLPAILSDPVLQPYLSATSSNIPESTGDGQSGTIRRKWEDEPPAITVVVTVPDGVNGEQMLAQWIGSAVGGDHGREWLWRWGRVRLAVLVGKGMYDVSNLPFLQPEPLADEPQRLMARPRETINCKLSIMTSSLFHRRPLTPHHHVANVDKAGKRTSSTPIKPSPKSKSTIPSIIDPVEGDWTHSTTTTTTVDFYPAAGRAGEPQPLPRPTLLGIELTPRLDSPILPSQKDAWDFVLRNCFVREGQPLSEVSKNLGFGAENLLERFADDKEGHEKRWRGTPVDPDTKAKDLTNLQWARVVDVFDKWAFKPESLMLSSDLGLDSSREMGVD